MKEYDIAVLIGRLQPFHLGHVEAIKTALNKAQHVFILLGSCNKAPDIKNPFTFEERRQMIVDAMWEVSTSHDMGRMHFFPLNDHLYSDANWIAQVQGAVATMADNIGLGVFSRKITLVGFKKDASSRYLNWFPQWDFCPTESYKGIHATDIRADLFEMGEITKAFLPLGTIRFLEQFKQSDPRYDLLCKEWSHITTYKKQFEVLPYPPIFVTTDAVVICKGHVLVVKRRSHPGKGLWALPGGFIKDDERIVDGIIRELVEETQIGVSTELLKSALKGTHTFDAPNRSLRGRTITHAGLIVLHSELPKVKGSDDAEKAKWVPINDAYSSPEKYFEDHAHIISFMVNRAF